ncbi:MAG: hypothetical protein MJ180_03455 [Candidatus Gastranaerophilales bacterium]|nr:hypothetical protein [Candidatus Gastranaerophilales bacterium]
MISAIARGLSNSTLANITQNTTARVSIETTLKAIGRPGFILIDNDIDSQTKKYAATKEFLYQAICLAVYLMVIPPVFKKTSFALGKKIFGKTHPEFSKFNNLAEYLDYHKFATKSFTNRRATLCKTHSINKFKHHNLREDLYTKENPDKYDLIKGCVEAGSFIGSILGLAIFAPQISHYTIHPIMNFLGMNKNPKEKNQKA